MDYLLILLAYLMVIGGTVGAVLPVIPGPPISFVGLLLLTFCDYDTINPATLIVAGVMAIVITVIDYIAPLWLTKRVGGSRAGIWGATIGLIVGLFAGIIGVILGPFLGALIGELVSGTPTSKAINIACVNFLAFILTTGMKLLYGIVVMAMVFVEGWRIIWS